MFSPRMVTNPQVIQQMFFISLFDFVDKGEIINSVINQGIDIKVLSDAWLEWIASTCSYGVFTTTLNVFLDCY